MEFPKMIYLGGMHGAEHRIVADQSEQSAAKADGFLPVGEHFKAKETESTSEPHAETFASDDLPADAPLDSVTPAQPFDEKADLIAALTAAGKTFDKRWGINKLRAAAKAKPE